MNTKKFSWLLAFACLLAQVAVVYAQPSTVWLLRGTTVPSACTAGVSPLFYKTDSASPGSIYYCGFGNVYVEFGTGGGGGGVAPYSAAVTAQTSVSIPVATHGQGTMPLVYSLDSSGASVSTAVVNSGCPGACTGNLTVTYFPAFTGRVVVAAGGGSGTFPYPGAGVPNSTGSAWGTSYTVGTSANNLVQLNGSAQLPAVSAALLTGLPLATGVSGILPVLNGGTGTSTPALVAGTNVTITGTWPNQTVNSSGGSGTNALEFTFNTAAGTCSVTVGTGSCTASNTAGSGSVPGVVVTHNLGKTTVWPALIDSSRIAAGSTAPASAASVIGWQTDSGGNITTITLSAALSGSGGISAGGSGPTGASGSNGTNGAGYAATSTSSLLIAVASKTFTTQAGLAYSAGARARASSAANTANYMEGLVTSYSGTTLIINVDTVGGSGTLNDWNINVAGNTGTGSTTVNGQTCTLGSSCTIPLSGTNAQTSTYQVLASDFSSYKTIIVASGTFTITLVASGSQPADGQHINILNYGTGVVTVARSGQNINGGTASLTLAAGSASAPTGVRIISNATDYFAQPFGAAGSSTVTSNIYIPLAAQYNPAGTATAIPSSWVKLPATNYPTPTHFANPTTGYGKDALGFTHNGGTDQAALVETRLPDTWTGTLTIVLHTYGNSAGTAAVHSVATACTTDTTDLAAVTYNTATSVTTTYPGSSFIQKNITFSSVNVTGCSAGNNLAIQLKRVGSDGADTAQASYAWGMTFKWSY